MYDVSKREEMLKSGFWPEKDEAMATAVGNLIHSPELCERFSLCHGHIKGEKDGLVVVFFPDK